MCRSLPMISRNGQLLAPSRILASPQTYLKRKDEGRQEDPFKLRLNNAYSTGDIDGGSKDRSAAAELKIKTLGKENDELNNDLLDLVEENEKLRESFEELISAARRLKDCNKSLKREKDALQEELERRVQEGDLEEAWDKLAIAKSQLKHQQLTFSSERKAMEATIAKVSADSDSLHNLYTKLLEEKSNLETALLQRDNHIAELKCVISNKSFSISNINTDRPPEVLEINNFPKEVSLQEDTRQRAVMDTPSCYRKFLSASRTFSSATTMRDVLPRHCSDKSTKTSKSFRIFPASAMLASFSELDVEKGKQVDPPIKGCARYDLDDASTLSTEISDSTSDSSCGGSTTSSLDSKSKNPLSFLLLRHKEHIDKDEAGGSLLVDFK